MGPAPPVHRVCALLVGISALLPAGRAEAQQQGVAAADVVVVVDTSVSMREEGMDPERSSLLVTKLLADIVPGDLSVVRLLDLTIDAQALPHRKTDQRTPCIDDPGKTCVFVEPAGDWEADALGKQLGALARPARGDASYKQQLEDHLDQKSHNSMFHLALRAAQGVFAAHATTGGRRPGVPRTVIWLSDGRSESPDSVRAVVGELVKDGTAVEAIVFGRGDLALANSAGLTPLQVSSPAGIMKAFANAFRRIVQAPYKIDNEIAVEPSFLIKPNVDEAWVVVYGDDTLAEAGIDGPSGPVAADYAADRWEGAGAYRVAYMQRPLAGRWTVQASGGGPGVAYAVVQRSALTPVLLEPSRAVSGAKVPLVAALRAGPQGDLIHDPDLLRGLAVTAEFQGRVVPLLDNGMQGDPVAADGRFTAAVTFTGTGKVPVKLRASSDLLDRTVEAEVDVSGVFRYTGGPVELDLGALGVNDEACQRLTLQAEHHGEVPFELSTLQPLPGGHRLEARVAAKTMTAGGEPVGIRPTEAIEVCLTTSSRAASSVAQGEPWLELRVAGSDTPEQRVTIRLRWQVRGLSFWQRWGWLILTILAILLVLLIIAGFVLPHRFQGALALSYVPERHELDEQTPQPVKQWQGVGIGFYRHARAYLHGDFRISGKPQGALAALHAEKGGALVVPGRGSTLFRETLEGNWESVPPGGRRARAGDVYRIADRGPFFRISTRGRG